MTSIAKKYIPLSVPEVRGNEWTYIKECLDTGWVSTVGSYVERFEQAIAQAVGTKHAVATNCGTAALHIALLAAGVEPNDEVVTSTLTFIAPANAIRYAGAWPVFIDAERDHWQMDTKHLEYFLENECERRAGTLHNRATGRRVKAILPVHILGHPVDMDSVMNLARKYDLRVIEDATESLGAAYRGQSVGSLGDIACFSFNGNKLITTGGGGMIVTNSGEWAARSKYLTTQAKDDPLEYVHGEIGYNYRLTNIQAAMGVAQIENLEAFVAAKRAIASAYDEALERVAGITPMRTADWAKSACWMYTVLVDEAEFGMSSRELMRELDSQGIQTRPLWQPLHLSNAHTHLRSMDLPVAEWLNRNALSLPCSVGLTNEEQGFVIDQVGRLQRSPDRSTIGRFKTRSMSLK